MRLICFSAYIILQLGKADAHRLILGAAYQYKADVIDPKISLAIKKFSDEHGIPAQRFFSILCLAYGADKQLFADILEKGYLPKERAEGCEGEYEQAAYAFKTLIGPHIGKRRAKKIFEAWMRTVNTRPKYQVRQ